MMLQEKHITLEKHFEELYIYGMAYQVHCGWNLLQSCPLRNIADKIRYSQIIEQDVNK